MNNSLSQITTDTDTLGQDYHTFLASKRITAQTAGIDVPLEAIHEKLFDFQKVLVQWALRKGRAALFTECGTGKSFMQLSWADIIHHHTDNDVLILAPLAVASQTVSEGAKLDIPVHICRSHSDVRPGINVTNYEMLHHFDARCFVGVVLDESSCLKNFSGKLKRTLVETFANIPYKLCCTATPAPNDVMEIGNHSEFLGVMPSSEMLMRWFINDTMQNGHYRLKGHAQKAFWEWVASWAISLRKPSDIGFSDQGFVLPKLQVLHRYVETDITIGVEEGQLFRAPAMSATTLHKEMRITAADRAQAVADIVNASHGVLTLTGNCDKLAACGRKNTPNGDALNTNQTSKNESSDVLKAEHLKRIGNTCTPTTKQTPNDLTSTDEHTQTNVISDDESGTQTTLNTEIEYAQRHAVITQKTPQKNEMPDCVPTSASVPSNTMPSLQNKMGSAQSVNDLKLAEINTEPSASPLTTTIQAGKSGDCSVQAATSESASSEMILTSCDKQQTTSSKTQTPEPWIIWCNTNYEQEELEKHFGSDRAFSVYGSLPPLEKERRVLGWLNGERPILISKPSICGYGLNFQHCHKAVFVGLSYSFEDVYQAIRRIYRFGQQHEVEITIVAATTETPLVAALKRKIDAHMHMSDAMNQAASRYALQENVTLTKYNPQVPMILPSWLQRERGAA